MIRSKKNGFLALVIVAMNVPAMAGTVNEGVVLDPRCRPLPTNVMGPFVNLPDGGVLAVHGNATVVSADDGQSWSKPRPLFVKEQEGASLLVSDERALVRTRGGVIVLIFRDRNSFFFKWGDEKVQEKNRCPVWAVRSLDDGKSWTDLQMVHDGYCGAIRDIIETHDGKLVATSQLLLPKFSRHAMLPVVSADHGKTWKLTNLIDIGGYGDHGGCFEATVFEQRDHRLRLLIRTNLGRFWSAFSEDSGLSWQTVGPSNIEAGSSPAMVKRLASGRLVLLWNRMHAQGSPKKELWFRRELSMAFSEDDGQGWTSPAVVARLETPKDPKHAWLAYPYVFERRPGELWITTMQGRLRMRLHEKDFAGQ